MLVDTHSHLDMPEFDSDRQEVVSRASQARVRRIVTVGIDLMSSERAVALAEQLPSVVAAVGIHPNELAGWSVDVIDSLRTLAAHPRVVAIGETGLDLYRRRSPLSLQMDAFRGQLRLAAELGLPVIVHDREAHDAVLHELSDWVSWGSLIGQRTTGVLHAFSGDSSMAAEVVALGFYVSVAGPVTFPRAGQLREVCRKVPLDRLLLETDSPYLAPQPVRGRRNEPAYVEMVARKVAGLRGMDMVDLCRATSENAHRLFTRVKDGEG